MGQKEKMPDMDIGVSVGGIGFKYRDLLWHQTAQIRNSELQQEFRFCLKPTASDTAPGWDNKTGCFVFFEIKGFTVYSVFMSIKLVLSLKELSLQPGVFLKQTYGV